MIDILKQQHSFAHDNAKQVFSLFTTWYTFFWTMNAGVLGWLYSPQAVQIANVQRFPGRLYLSVLFILLNILGIGVCFFCWRAIRQLRTESLKAAEQWAALTSASTHIEPSTGLVPEAFIHYVFAGGGLSLIMNLIAWILLPITTHA